MLENRRNCQPLASPHGDSLMGDRVVEGLTSDERQTMIVEVASENAASIAKSNTPSRRRSTAPLIARIETSFNDQRSTIITRQSLFKIQPAMTISRMR
ncbi:MAG: hypothetical protein RIC55_22225 [Pirellulaceae bacterium]